MALVTLAVGCAEPTNDPGTSSESHFLSPCAGADSCPEGLDCICGTCSTPCLDSGTCGALADGARCFDASATGQCSEQVLTCDLTCDEDLDCAALGDGSHRCVDGVCRDKGEDAAPLTLSSPTVCTELDADNAPGPVFYVCGCPVGAENCTNGDDGNDGTSPESPFLTSGRALDAVQGQAGWTVAFCRGGAMELDAPEWPTEGCSTTTPCTLRDYLPEAAGPESEKPVLNASGDPALTFAPSCGNADDVAVSINGIALLGDGTGRGLLLRDGTGHVDLCGVQLNSFAVGVQVVDAGCPQSGPVDQVSVSARAIQAFDNTVAGWQGGCSGCTLTHGFFSNNGTAVADAAIAWTTPPNRSASGGRVTHNKIFRNAEDTACQGGQIDVFGQFDGLEISYNELLSFDEPPPSASCRGIALRSADDGQVQSYADVAIVGNRIETAGSKSVTLDTCTDCLLENNAIVVAGTGLEAVAVSADEAPFEDLISNLVVRHNSIYLGADVTAGAAFNLSTADGLALVNNAALYLGVDSFNFAALPAMLNAGDTVDYNVAGAPSASAFFWDGTRMEELATFQSSTGQAFNSLAEDPLFEGPGPEFVELNPAEGSPLLDAADPDQSPLSDRVGRLRGDVPDIGARER